MEFNIGSVRTPAPLNAFELTGRVRSHVVQIDAPRLAAQPDALAAFLALREAARRDGIELEPYSAFRDFAAQAKIWNDKWLGKRPLYDRAGRLLDYASLDDAARMSAILQWSALPGASRHHWGSDIDVIDRAAVTADYRVRLLPEEYAAGGVFARLAAWVDQHAGEFGFYRPYARDFGGVSPEPWHLSYAPVAAPALAALTPTLLADALRDSAVLGKEQVLRHLDTLHARYVANVTPPPSRVLLIGSGRHLP